MAVSVAGVGIFAFPHPLHNVFGEAELIGYQAPLVLSLTWRHDRQARNLLIFSSLMIVAVWIAIAINLTTLSRHGPIWTAIKPVYGLAQRALFAAWFAWIAGTGILLFKSDGWKAPEADVPDV
jgi:hypothetical protein